MIGLLIFIGIVFFVLYCFGVAIQDKELKEAQHKQWYDNLPVGAQLAYNERLKAQKNKRALELLNTKIYKLEAESNWSDERVSSSHDIQKLARDVGYNVINMQTINKFRTSASFLQDNNIATDFVNMILNEKSNKEIAKQLGRPKGRLLWSPLYSLEDVDDMREDAQLRKELGINN